MLELDELRRQWQQPENALPPVSPAELGGMLTRNAGGLVVKMRRNTWYEAALTLFLAVAAPCYAWYSWGQEMLVLMAALMFVISVVLLVNYGQQLQLLRRMGQPEIQVRAHLEALCAGLRRQLQFYYRLTLATGPVTLLMLLCFYVGKELVRPGDFRWLLLAGVAAAFVVLGAVVHVVIVYLTRWYLQRLYGQHLDRIEASLAELAEPEPTSNG